MDLLPLVFASFLIATCYCNKELARGFGDEINWVTLEHARANPGKPTMVIIHKSWCGACKKLKPQFSSSYDIKQLSSNFWMVNLENNEEPNEEQFNPDGKYIPRIFFLDQEGKIDHSIYNTAGNDKYKYFYFDAIGVISSMKRALKKFTGKEEL